MTKVLIAGTFDIIHPGHLNLIKQAKGLGDFLVVIVARDVNVKKMKGMHPYFNENRRLIQLKDILSKIAPRRGSGQERLEDWKIVLGDLHDPYKIIREEKPEVIALGYDQQTYVGGLNDLLINSHLKFKIKRLEPFKENVCKGKNVRQAVEDKGAGFLLINKPSASAEALADREDWTSHDVIAKLRSITGIKQIGHTGTLDPFATGLLICPVSQATKIAGIFNILSKTYEATITLGLTSDTYDRTGKILNSNIEVLNKSKIKNSNVQNVLKSFVGKQLQLPPMFSAKKVAGQKLYEIARQGKIVKRKPSEIEIHEIELLKSMIQDLRPSFVIRVECSTGTYIRTLAHDIGQRLGIGAILEELKRTAIGDFNINQAVQLEEVSKDNYLQYLIKPLEAINRVNLFYARCAWQ